MGNLFAVALLGSTKHPTFYMSLIPLNYYQSRIQFINLSHAIGADLKSYSITSPTAHASLSIDTAFLGSELSNLVLVVLSGVHGVEGYVGAACLQHLLQRYKRHYQRSNLSFLLVHALNPWGFANDCRVTEHNVDLNRNFINFSESLPSPTQYAKFHSTLCEHYFPGLKGLLNELRLFKFLLNSRQRRMFQQAVTGGQYHYRDGLFYGGHEATENHTIWLKILQAHLRPAQQLRFLDIHTGLGKKAYGALLTHLPVHSHQYAVLNNWLEHQLVSTNEGSAISAEVKGPLLAHTERMFGERCFTVTLEFGVKGPLPTLNALRADNWLRTRTNSATSEKWRSQIKQQLKDAFLARDPDWEKQVLNRFEWTVDRLIDSFPDK